MGQETNETSIFDLVTLPLEAVTKDLPEALNKEPKMMSMRELMEENMSQKAQQVYDMEKDKGSLEHDR